MIFISYAHEDAEFVERLCEQLTVRGMPFLRDERSFTHGRLLPKEVERVLGMATSLVVIWSEHAARSGWVELELSAAMTRASSFRRFG